jgi:hypothetical protein
MIRQLFYDNLHIFETYICEINSRKRLLIFKNIKNSRMICKGLYYIEPFKKTILKISVHQNSNFFRIFSSVFRYCKNARVSFHFFSVDSSLPLMDEIGRRALTNAFIHFAKETGRKRRFLYNPVTGIYSFLRP